MGNNRGLRQKAVNYIESNNIDKNTYLIESAFISGAKYIDTEYSILQKCYDDLIHEAEGLSINIKNILIEKHDISNELIMVKDILKEVEIESRGVGKGVSLYLYNKIHNYLK